MHSVREAAERIGRSPSSVRNYSNQFADYMSQGGREAGENRLFSDQDLAVLATISALKKARKAPEEIKATLDADELVDLPPGEQKGAKSPDFGGQEQMALVTQLTASVALFEGELKATKETLEVARLQLETERDARISAEKEASRLAGQLDNIYRQSWYQFWRPKKPEEET